MTEPSLAHRVELLERQNRRLHRWLTVLAVTAGSLVWMAQIPGRPQEIRSRGFVLVNQKGETRAELTVVGDLPSLTLRNQAGEVLVRVTGNGARAVLELRDFSGDLHDIAAPPRPQLLTAEPR